jgi:hypothetical protein
MKAKTGFRVTFLFATVVLAGGYVISRFWHPSPENGILWLIVVWIGGTTQMIKFEVNDIWEKLGQIEGKLDAVLSKR